MLMVLTLNMAGAQTSICLNKQLEIHKLKTHREQYVWYIGSIRRVTNVTLVADICME